MSPTRARVPAVSVSDADIFERLAAAPDLALTSRTAYAARLRKVLAVAASADAADPARRHAPPPSLAHVLTLPARYVPVLAAARGELASKQAWVSALLAVFKHTAALPPRTAARALPAWTAANKELCARLEARAAENARTPHEQAARVTLADARALEARLRLSENGSPRHLLLAWHTLWPPNRGGDAGAVRLLASSDHDDGLGNVLVLSPHPPVFKLRDHKTAKHHGTIERALPPDLAQVLAASLAARPRAHLFETGTAPSRSPHPPALAGAPRAPFATERAFQQWASRALAKLFDGRPVTVNSLRHAFVNAMDLPKMSTRKLADVARAMGHTVHTQLKAYRRVDDDAPTDAVVFRPQH